MPLLLIFAFYSLLLLPENILPESKYREEGLASFYSDDFHGKATASGEAFDIADFTAAHLTLPFNTYLKVVNTSNRKNVLIRVNDRGPYIKDRIIDLSEGAARKIGSYDHGITYVKLEQVHEYNLNPEYDRLFRTKPVMSCLGNIDQLRSWSIRLWSTNYLFHALYIANDLYLKEDVDNVLICGRGKNKFRKYFVVITGIASKPKAENMIVYFRNEGFLDAGYFQ